MSRLVVAGGGAAGIAAALEAARAGWKTTLCEARHRLGGRAFSFAAPAFGGAELENGPHALLGAYAEFRRLLRALGTEELFERAPALRLAVAVRGGARSFRAWPGLPGPLSLLGGLLGFGLLTVSEKVRTARAMAALVYGPPPAEEPVAEWLARRRLEGAPAETLLIPLCRAVLNTHESVASLALLAAAFRGSFRGRASGAALWLPAAPWGRILEKPARERLGALGAEVRLRARVESVDLAAGRVAGVRLAGGERLDCQALVWAVPPWQGKGALPGGLVREGLAPAPMATLYDRAPEGPRWPEPIVSLGPRSEFDFAVVLPGGQLVAALVSGRLGPLPGGRSRLREAGLWVPQPAATLHQPAGCDRLRPGAATGVAGLFLAGDWTATGLPATLEGAALSGRRAGRLAAEFLAGARSTGSEENLGGTGRC